MKIKKSKKEKPALINIKISKEDLVRLKIKANLYTDGNLSHWLRYAGMNHLPSKKDLV